MGPEAGAPGGDADEVQDFALTLIRSRENVSAKSLGEPGPSEAQLEAMLAAAAAAPDHGRLTPWRFIIVAREQRHRLGEAFALALLDRDPAATPAQVEAARAKAQRAPLLMVAVACLGPRERDVPALERMLSMGAAVQNLLLAAHAMGFGAGLTSGQAMASGRMRRLCGLAEGEQAVCCINIGTATARVPRKRVRPEPARFVTRLAED